MCDRRAVMVGGLMSLTLGRASFEFVQTELDGGKASRHTIEGYTSDIVQVGMLCAAALDPRTDGMLGEELAAWAKANVDESVMDTVTLDQLTYITLQRAFSARGATRSQNTVLRSHTAMRRLMAWAVAARVLPGDPMAGIKTPRKRVERDEEGRIIHEIRSIDVDSRDDFVGRILAAAGTVVPPTSRLEPGSALAARQADNTRRVPYDRYPWPERNVALLAVLIYTALRLDEVCTLTNANYREIAGDRYLDVLGKGARPRQLLVHPRVEQALADYRESDLFHTVGSLDGPAPLLCDRHGNQLSHRTVQRRVEKVLKLADLWEKRAKGALVHALRHTVATQLVKDGVPTPAVQNFLGHASQDTTMRYVQGAAQDQVEILGKL